MFACAFRRLWIALPFLLVVVDRGFAVVISEVYYHPLATEGHDVEFIELHEPSGRDVPLAGWSLSGAVEFTFPADAVLPAGGYLVVGRDGARLSEHFGLDVERVVGPYVGALPDSGGHVILANDTGAFVDAVLYDDEGPWPRDADGRGAALVRRCFEARADTYRDWGSAPATPLSSGGEDCASIPPETAPRVAISEIHYHPVVSLAQVPAGEDGEDAEFVEVANLGAESIDLTGWRLRGVDFAFPPGLRLDPGAFLCVTRSPEAFRRAYPERAVVGGYAGRLSNKGERLTLEDAGGEVVDSVRYTDRDPWPYTADGVGSSLERIDLTAESDEPANWRAAEPSPSAPGEAAGQRPPSIRYVSHFPREPRGLEPVWVTARVLGVPGGPPPVVTLVHNSGAALIPPAIDTRMADNGRNGDGAAGDGVYGVRLTPFAHDTEVRFRVVARQGGQTAESPVPACAGNPRAEEVWGFYVNDLQSESALPTYHVLLHGVNGRSFEEVNRALSCDRYVRASFAFRGELYPDVDVRFRGNTMCLVKKRNFKVRFRRGRLFRGLRKLNLNSLWTDKSLVREQLAWELQRELGLPYCETGYAQLHVSGSYYGLFLELEHPDERFLERNGLDERGSLYKATSPGGGELRIGVEESTLEGYRRRWEGETSPPLDFTDLEEFIDAMHWSGLAEGGPSRAFWQQRSHEDLVVAYQAGQVLLNNLDGARKNHFLYHDLASGRWTLLPWDLDLAFGKYFDRCAVDLGIGRRAGTLNDVMLCAPPSVPKGCTPDPLDPWYATSIGAPEPRNWFLDFFFRAGNGHYQRAYLKRLWDALRDKYRRDEYDARVREIVARIDLEAARDFDRWGRYPSNVPDFPPDLEGNLEVFLEQVACHHAALRDFLLETDPTLARSPIVKFTEIHYLPGARSSPGEYLEATNLTPVGVDLSGWSVSGAVEYTFPDGSRVEPGEVFLIARSPATLADLSAEGVSVFGPFAGKLSNDGEALLLKDAGPGHPAVVDRVAYDTEGRWPRVRPGESLALRVVARDSDNDRGVAWGARTLSPGTVPGAFLRGDANGDRRVNIADPLEIIGSLFRAAKPLACPDAADSNDSGRIDLTDVIFLLNHLFLGGPQPPEPFLRPGNDLTVDMLECAVRFVTDV